MVNARQGEEEDGFSVKWDISQNMTGTSKKTEGPSNWPFGNRSPWEGALKCSEALQQTGYYGREMRQTVELMIPKLSDAARRRIVVHIMYGAAWEISSTRYVEGKGFRDPFPQEGFRHGLNEQGFNLASWFDWL